MYQRKRVCLLISIVALIFITIVVLSYLSKPRPADLAAPMVKEIQSVVTKMIQLQQDLVCQSGTDVSVLDEVLVDSSDYRPSFQDLSTIQKVYGLEAMTHAGYLTSQKAYYLSRRTITPANPDPGIKPTAPPIYYCPTPSAHIDIEFIYFGLRIGNRAVVQFDYSGGFYEAFLREVDSRWVVTSVKLLKWHGI